MSKKKNYRSMYNNQTECAHQDIVSFDTDPVEEVVEEIETPAVEIEVPVEPAEEKCEFVIGTVTGCARLNVREAPETMSEVICTIPVWSEVQVCLTHKNDLWYHVYTAAGQEGYCMKQFIEINR